MSRKNSTRAQLAAMAERERLRRQELAPKPVEGSPPQLPSEVPNRADLRHAGINITNRTGRPNARLKKARASHKKKAGE